MLADRSAISIANSETGHTLVAEIVVESRNTIRPFFKVPALTSAVGFQLAVRGLEGYVAHTLSYSNPQELHVRIARLVGAAGWAF